MFNGNNFKTLLYDTQVQKDTPAIYYLTNLIEVL
jgi:hypothetical protein